MVPEGDPDDLGRWHRRPLLELPPLFVLLRPGVQVEKEDCEEPENKLIHFMSVLVEGDSDNKKNSKCRRKLMVVAPPI